MERWTNARPGIIIGFIGVFIYNYVIDYQQIQDMTTRVSMAIVFFVVVVVIDFVIESLRKRRSSDDQDSDQGDE